MIRVRVDVEHGCRCRAKAAATAAMTPGSRPSETFGTDSSSATDLLYGAGIMTLRASRRHGTALP